MEINYCLSQGSRYRTEDVFQIVKLGCSDNRCRNEVFGQTPGDRHLGHTDSLLIRNLLNSAKHC